MDDPWRFHGNLCPVCSSSHFPFCQPPPPFPGEYHRRFPPPPLPYEPPPPLPPPQSFWGRAPGPPAPFPPPPPPPTPGFPPPPWFGHEDFSERERFQKRMRVGEHHPSGNLPPPPTLPYNPCDIPLPPQPNQVSVDDERRLNLIRDHGRQSFSEAPQNSYPSVGSGHSFCDSGFGHASESAPDYQNQHMQRTMYKECGNSERSTDPQNVVGFTPRERNEPGGDGAYVQPIGESWQQVSYPNPDYASGGPHEKYYAHDHHRFHLSENSYMLPHQSPYAAKGSNQIAAHLINHDERRSYAAYLMHDPAKDEFELHSQNARQSATHDLASEKSSAGATGHNAVEGLQQSYTSMPPPPIAAAHYRGYQSDFHMASSAPTAAPALFPVLSSASATVSLPPNGRTLPETHPLPQANCYNMLPARNSSQFISEGLTFASQAPSDLHMGNGLGYPSKNSLKNKVTVVSASHLFKQPHRASRPDHIVIILRGLPGSGKSYLAKALRDLEVEIGGNAPRIHAMDDYFMIEVEKVEDNDGNKSSSSFRGKKQSTKKAIEYCYEPEMEETYRASMLKAFKKTLDEGIFTFVIVDDRNLRVADFAQFWAIGKRAGYEVYLLEAPYKDPMGCAARNVHGFTLEDVERMAESWEDSPPLYLKLDIQSLFHGDDLNEQSIQEVEMEADDADYADGTQNVPDKEDSEHAKPKSSDYEPHSAGERWNTEEEEELTEVKEIGRSKWSKDLEEDAENSDGGEENTNVLSGILQAYGTNEKSVHWSDQVNRSGFSIGASKKRGTSSLIIGPGPGYNLDSNPLVEKEDAPGAKGGTNTETKRRFSEQLRAERESFRAAFDRRRHRIGGLNNNIEDE
ncbi:YLP motif-containing protein 1-like [Ananas comosus]|uniref:YLP motif-containing protein 1-like n=1 Tax=Ananas comosus TaxID=4615 RepID=A0A6P5EGJ7_ANACO|nr:YLP motif-containing protein 1-like [Ananas comosus]XP_020088229.1 YLP motif-containing protein 1-like [Ananas comosus]